MEAEIVDERPSELIAWRSLADADVRNAGTVVFERGPGGRGTTIRVSLSYAPPGGTLRGGCRQAVRIRAV